MSNESSTSDIERQFARVMRDIYLRAKDELGYNATYFLRVLLHRGSGADCPALDDFLTTV